MNRSSPEKDTQAKSRCGSSSSRRTCPVALALSAVAMLGALALDCVGGGEAGATFKSGTDSLASQAPSSGLRLPGDYHLFTHSGTWVAPRAGTYMVVAVGGGGGGGGGGAAMAGGVANQVGGAGGSAGAVTINDMVTRAGRRFRISVGQGGTPGAGGPANGGSGGLGGNGGVSSFPGVASADGGTGGPGGPGNSSSTVLAPVGAGRSSLGDMQAPGSAGAATATAGEPSGSSFLYAWPGGGGGGPAGSGRGGSGGGAAGASGAIAPGGRVGAMSRNSGGHGFDQPDVHQWSRGWWWRGWCAWRHRRHRRSGSRGLPRHHRALVLTLLCGGLCGGGEIVQAGTEAESIHRSASWDPGTSGSRDLCLNRSLELSSGPHEHR